MFPAQLASSLRVGARTILIIHVCPSLYVIVQWGLLVATLFTMETKSFTSLEEAQGART
ncbi:uncharacterized protein BO72DRAFT_453617 [Aspergillus fijiensis CBS 313.89]|uniref:Uncharacterized protein n=1 Tax=Aspergillus fijiensis CBS 313.89 TaxID=1448319 RepID=A0A8G1VW24_9EURO|nr:uncharacterized protein BO72DRAFT_453617 [Aspergillus fijiensis CBS 313.89]RAK71539.1 hypothetical protein BO72DRAFT_453617 [Aspergillus fijiensis CBS 313.89]